MKPDISIPRTLSCAHVRISTDAQPLTFQKETPPSPRNIFPSQSRTNAIRAFNIAGRFPRVCKTLYEVTVHRTRLNPVAAKIFQSVKKLFLHFRCNPSIEEIPAVHNIQLKFFFLLLFVSKYNPRIVKPISRCKCRAKLFRDVMKAAQVYG